jgi:peptide-methionine (S)-S-oxide reductase
MAPIKGNTQSINKEVAILGAGCFWCVEAVFEELKGVILVESGYMGGTVDNPTYAQICTGRTGHAEVARITYDSEILSFKDILEVFWKTHDPTTLNQQGADKGTQYRSAIFYLDDSQKEVAAHYKARLEESNAFSAPIVTEIVAASEYYNAENYHQDYFKLNPDQGYCRYVIQPKLEKFREAFADKLK